MFYIFFFIMIFRLSFYFLALGSWAWILMWVKMANRFRDAAAFSSIYASVKAGSKYTNYTLLLSNNCSRYKTLKLQFCHNKDFLSTSYLQLIVAGLHHLQHHHSSILKSSQDVAMITYFCLNDYYQTFFIV